MAVYVVRVRNDRTDEHETITVKRADGPEAAKVLATHHAFHVLGWPSCTALADVQELRR